MAIRLPLYTVLSSINNDEVGAGSVSGGANIGMVPLPVVLPQDTDNVVVKLTASTVGGGVSAVFQTTDDGGNTWYDVARTSVVSNTAGNTLAQWLSIPVINAGQNASRPVTGSVLTTIGSAGASTLGSAQFSGLPILSQQARVGIILTGNLTTSSITTQVKVNNQSATA